MTVLTDLVLGICNARWGTDLVRQGCSRRQFSQVLWGIGFLAAAIAAILGGLSHAVGDQSPETRRKLWKGTIIATGFTSASMFASTATALTANPLKGKLLAATLIKLLAYCGWMASRDRFLYVIIDYGTAMAGVVALHVPALLRRGSASSLNILAGVGVSLVAAVIQMRKMRLHEHFNHNDLYHVVQLGACYILYKGGRKLRDFSDPLADGVETQEMADC
jgi:hypothetical protein